jgi:hypothetical protein
MGVKFHILIRRKNNQGKERKIQFKILRKRMFFGLLVSDIKGGT